MPTAKKEATIEELREKIASAKNLFFTNYQGLTVEQITKLRNELRKDGSTYGVVKNTLFRRAASEELAAQLDAVLAGPTGIVFAAPFAATVAVGRWGCFFSGLADFTYGTPTTVPWGVDFGDGIARHPVQLYESIAMAAMFVVLIQRFIARDRFWLKNGFYLVVGWYALQRFVWEFFKPYATVIGPFNLFHVVCLGLVLYAAAMIRSGGRDVRWHSA